MTDVSALAARTRLLILDVDGVLTDGRLYRGPDGLELKAFHVHDGRGIRELLSAGIAVAVISGRPSPATRDRMTELGVEHVYLACADKPAALNELCNKTGIDAADAAFVGDDVPALDVMERVGFPIAVANAHASVRAAAAWTTGASGGAGAVREVCDLIIAARNGTA